MSDSVLMEVLRKVGLGSRLISDGAFRTDPNTSPHSLLERNLDSLPVLSTGQSQLLSLARAIVKRRSLTIGDQRKPILLLDEATSSLDRDTEHVMHELIDEEFVTNGHTVLMVTHRPDVLFGRMRAGRDLFVYMKDGTIDKVLGS